MKKYIKFVGGITLITILLLFLIEILLRIFYSPPPGDYSAITSDPVLNHKWKQNVSMTESGRGVTPYKFYTNNQGWVGQKDVAVKKPKDTIRLVYVGDSNVAGVVPDEDKMAAIVGKTLDKEFSKSGKKVEVINTGTPSYSPSLYYVLLTTQLMKYEPDIVVINVDMTDVRDDAHYKTLTSYDKNGLPLAVKPTAAEIQAEYKLTPQGIVRISSTQQFIEMLRKNTALFYNLEKFYYHFAKNQTLRKMFFKSEISTTPPIDANSWLAKQWTKTAQHNTDYSMFILGKTIDYLHEKNVKVIITGVPHYPQYSGEWSAKPHQIIDQTAKNHKALHFNSYELLKNKISGTEVATYYWDVDPTHFNTAGNKIWADAQAAFLLKNKDLLLRKQEP